MKFHVDMPLSPEVAALSGIPHSRIGEVTADGVLQILAESVIVVSADISALKEAWHKPLRW